MMTFAFADKLRKLRDEANISQEGLAEVLDVSRQAVAKWEARTGMPEIKHLIQMSEYFQVSLDYLLKETAYPNTVSNEHTIDSEIVDFIVEAKKNTYANVKQYEAAKRPSTRLGSKDLAYEKGDFKYWDTYVGSSHFSGAEVVWHKEMPVWSMNYVGRLLEGQPDWSFLSDALAQVEGDMPYRGPAIYRNGKYTYVNRAAGTFDWFEGVEQIYYQDELIYELKYHGGMIR